MLSMPKNPLASLQGLFYPNSIAVVGASEDISKIGGYIFSQLLRVKSLELYPINIKNETIQGKKAYPSVEQIPKSADLVVIAVPSPFVIECVEDCIKKNIKNIVIITAGFKETGEEGKKKEEELKKLIQKHSLNVIGPNCLGFLNPEIGLNSSFAKDIPNTGGIGLVSQSGAVVDAIIDWSFEHNVGFSKIVSIGNMAGVSELDMLKYLSQDPKTTSIVFYMESLDEGEEFAKELKKTSKKKPVIIIKPGNSKNAQKAIGSHTGSLAQNGSLVKKLITQNNGIFVTTIDELYNILILVNSNTPKPQLNSLAIVTNAGGPGVIATDMLENSSFSLVQLQEKTKKELREFLPKEASVNNPIDVLGDAKSQRYEKTLKTLINKKEVGSILVLLTPQIMTDSANIARIIADISKSSSKPIITSFLGGKELKESFEVFKEEKISNFATPNQAIQALDKLYKYSNFNYNDRLIIPSISIKEVEKINKELFNHKGLLGYSITKKILKVLGVKLPEKEVFETKQEILEMNLPSNELYVLKAEGILHKKEENAVISNISSLNFHDLAIKMFTRLENKGLHPVLTLEKQVKGSEVIVGLKSQKDLGSFIMFGTGGSYVNIYEDISFAPCPITKKQAMEIIEETKISKILKGYRGDPSINMDALTQLLINLSFLQEYFPKIKEVDCNPVICDNKNVYLVDVKLVLEDKK